MENLSELLFPYSIDKFFADNWRKKGIYIAAQSREKFQHFFSWSVLSNLLNYHEKKYPSFRLAYEKKVLDEAENHNFLKHCQEGATVIIDGVDRRVPALGQLASAIRYDLGVGHQVQVNAYCSWPGKQGFDCHYDTHEVFILQIEGFKEWFVFPETIQAPLPDRPSADPPTDLEPYIHTCLAPGDLLYIPRGHWHYAIAKEQPSVHLTLGVHCKTGLDFLDWLGNKLKDKKQWRENLPFGVKDLNSESLKTYVESLTTDLLNDLQAESLSSEYADYLASLENPIASYDFPYQVGFGLEKIDKDTEFYRPPFQRVMFDFNTEAEQYRVRVGNKEVKLSGVPPHFLKSIFTEEKFTGHDVCQWLENFDWEVEIHPLLLHFVKERIIFINHSSAKSFINPDPSCSIKKRK